MRLCSFLVGIRNTAKQHKVEESGASAKPPTFDARCKSALVWSLAMKEVKANGCKNDDLRNNATVCNNRRGLAYRINANQDLKRMSTNNGLFIGTGYFR